MGILRKFVLAVLIMTTAVVGTANGAMAMDDKPGSDGETKLCHYGRGTYSEGSVKKHDNGHLYKCVGGKWVACSNTDCDTAYLIRLVKINAETAMTPTTINNVKQLRAETSAPTAKLERPSPAIGIR